MLLALVVLVLGAGPGVYSDVPPAQRQALVDLYTSTNGSSWTYTTNWLNGDPCADFWAQVRCNPNLTTVTCVSHAERSVHDVL
jgi:hypothetical protein